MSTSGGAGVINADKAEDNHLDLPTLHESTRSALTEVVPAFGSIGNPADLTAEVLKDAATFSYCLDAFTADPGLGAVVVPLVFVHEMTTGWGPATRARPARARNRGRGRLDERMASRGRAAVCSTATSESRCSGRRHGACARSGSGRTGTLGDGSGRHAPARRYRTARPRCSLALFSRTLLVLQR